MSRVTSRGRRKREAAVACSSSLLWLGFVFGAKASWNMPNQRQPGTKLAGAYISAEKDKALADLAALKGFTNKAEFIRLLFDDALAANAKNLKKTRNMTKPNR